MVSLAMAPQEVPGGPPPRPEVAGLRRPRAADRLRPEVADRLRPEAAGLQRPRVADRPRPEAAGRPHLRVVPTVPLAGPLVDVSPGSPPSTGPAPQPVPSVAPARAGCMASLPHSLRMLSPHPASRCKPGAGAREP